jgi:hypothetical protein
MMFEAPASDEGIIDVAVGTYLWNYHKKTKENEITGGNAK